MWCYCWSHFVSWPNFPHLKLAHCSRQTHLHYGEDDCVRRLWFQQASGSHSILFPILFAVHVFFPTSPDDGPEFRIEKSCKIYLDFHSSWYLSLGMPIFSIILDLSFLCLPCDDFNTMTPQLSHKSKQHLFIDQLREYWCDLRSETSRAAPECWKQKRTDLGVLLLLCSATRCASILHSQNDQFW